VLLLACINFMNLTTARSSNRAKEVGVRKVLGSERNQLIRQFTLESVLMVTVAMAIAVLLASLMRYPFSYMAGKELSFDVLRTPAFISFIVAFIVLLGIIAGSYPSLYLSSFNPVQVLKGKLRTGMRAGSLRNTLVILQFAISIVLITCTIIVQNQLQFLRAKKLGFDKENLMIVENANRIASAEAFMDELRTISGIAAVSAAYSKPVDDYNGTVLVTEEDTDTRKLVNFNIVDYDYLKTMNISLLEGRWFSKDRPSDSSAVVINETAANYLFSDPVGKKLYREKAFEVIGVIGDFNFESLKSTVRPLIFFLDNGQNHIHIRLEAGNYADVIGKVEALWKNRNADVPFIYSFADDEYNKLFAEESRLGMVFGTFTVLAIFIACLGLLGLMAYSVEQRTKEISVRKVLGASVYNIIAMLSGQFGRLILISLIISIPVAYFLMTKWLDQFAYKTSIGVFSLFIGSFLTLIVSLSIVTYQAFQAARVNPASTLKGE
jgi:putative ABC transport system permease protein